MTRIGLLGYGYWGCNLARNFQVAPGAVLAAIYDPHPARIAEAAAQYPGVQTASCADTLMHDPAIDAIAIATPAASHFRLAMAALEAGKHVWIEKPMACTAAHAATLAEEARRRHLVLMVDHTFVYSPAVRKIRELIQGGELGALYYYDSVRTNLGRFHNDTSVLWDLASHDLAILDYLLEEQPSEVHARGAAHCGEQHEVSYLSLAYPSGFHAHVHVSWLTPVKVRRVMLTGSKGLVLWNDLASARKIELYDHAIESEDGPEGSAGQRRIGYRAGGIRAPWLEVSEPLQNAVRHFIHCVETGETPLTDGEAGMRVIRLLEKAAGL